METPSQNILSDLISRAETKKHTDLKFIETWQEYLAARGSCKAIKLIIKGLKSNYNRLFKQYCKELLTGDASVNKLLVCQKLNITMNFYIEELDIISDMIDEYEAYLMSGNLIQTWLFNDRRPEDKFWDHRGK